MKYRIILAAVASFAMAGAVPAYAGGGHGGGGHGGGGWHGGGGGWHGGGGGWHGSGWHGGGGHWHGSVGVYLGPGYWGWPYYGAYAYPYGYPYGYPYAYPYAYYPYAYGSGPYVTAPASDYVERSPAPASTPPVYWYYCTDPPGYYPHVPQCNQPWNRVLPRDVPGSQAPESPAQ
jgi:hypothetical protein